MKLLAALLLSAPLFCQSPLCEEPAATRELVRQATKVDDLKALLADHPDDVWIHTNYQARQRKGLVYPDSVIAEYNALLALHPNDPEYLYLYGRTLIGSRTPDAIAAMNQALDHKPGFSPADLSLVEIYRYPNFKDAVKARSHIETWMSACPDSLHGYALLEKMETDDFIRKSVQQMRKILEDRSAHDSLNYYRVLWKLEFQVHPPSAYPDVRARIAGDLKRLRELDVATNRSLPATLRDGYKLAEDKTGLAWVDAEFPQKQSSENNSGMEVFQQFQKDHPYPAFKPGEAVAPELFKARNKALLDASAGWVKQWPDDHFMWNQRFSALQMNREAPDAEIEQAAKELLRTANATTRPSARIMIVSAYMTRNIHLSELVGMVRASLSEADGTTDLTPVSDLYPQNNMLSVRANHLNTRLSSLAVLVEIYFHSGDHEKIGQTLVELRAALDTGKPADTASAMEKNMWSQYEDQYWGKMARLATQEGAKADALAYYQNAIRTNSSYPAMGDYIKQQAKQLWIELGRTETDWNSWLAANAAPKAAAVATTMGGWERMNKSLPEFQIADMAGKTWTLADLKGKTTLINVWATWCAPCREELPHLQELYEKLKGRDDIRIITFNTDDNPGLIEPFLKEKKFTFPVLPAQALVDKIVPSLSIPRNWIVNRDNVMKLEGVGFGVSLSENWTDKMTETIASVK